MNLNRQHRRRLFALVAILSVLVSGCGATATPVPSWPAGALVVTAKDRRFDTTELAFSSSSDTPLVLVNLDSDSHNIAIRTQSGFDGDMLVRFDPISNTSVVLTVGPLKPGRYFFLCEVHPQMKGTVVVT